MRPAVLLALCIVFARLEPVWADEAGMTTPERAGGFTPLPRPADTVADDEVPQPSAQTLAHPCRGITDEAARLACFHKTCGL